MQHPGTLSYTLVGIQFGAILAVGLTGSWIARSPVWLGLELLALIPGCWALAVMLPGRFNIFPEVRQGAVLITRGPYRYLRHPMYTTVLLSTLALVLDNAHPARIAAWVILLFVIVFKMRREERILCDAFPDYPHYCSRTRRIIPWIY